MKRDTVRIWDLPTRVFHWALLAAVAGLFATAYVAHPYRRPVIGTARNHATAPSMAAMISVRVSLSC